VKRVARVLRREASSLGRNPGDNHFKENPWANASSPEDLSGPSGTAVILEAIANNTLCQCGYRIHLHHCPIFIIA
jgi:hypothetical protein